MSPLALISLTAFLCLPPVTPASGTDSAGGLRDPAAGPPEVRGRAVGACCDDDTDICTDDVLYDECPPPLRFVQDTLCDDLMPPCGGCPESMLTIDIMTDPYPEETTWTVTDHDTGVLICSGGPYADQYTLYTEYCCIGADDCIDFTIYDAYGDGIYAPGGYTVSLDGVVQCDTMGSGWYGTSSSCPNIGGGCIEPAIGRCCYGLWGYCVETTYNDCVANYDGEWTADTTCWEWPCPHIDAVIPPYTSPQRSTCGAGNDCPLASCQYNETEEHTYWVFIPHDGPWSFNTCLTTSGFDTLLTVGTEPCSDDLGCNDDACGFQSEILVYLTAGYYYCAVEGYSTCGSYILDIHELPCGDLNGDSIVDLSDYWVFVNAFGTCLGELHYTGAADFDADRCITLADYQAWVGCYRAANPGKAIPLMPQNGDTRAESAGPASQSDLLPSP